MTQAILLYKCRLCGKRVEVKLFNLNFIDVLAHYGAVTHDCEYPGQHGIADFVGYKELPEPEETE